MKIYFDESGQSGCLLLKNEMLNFKKQPVFTVASVLIENVSDEKKMLQKYRKFKQKFDFATEIKGTDLLTRQNNEALNYLLDNIIDSNHFRIIIYDKRFYLSTLLLLSLVGNIYQCEFATDFYMQASTLSFQEDLFFEEYLKYVMNPTVNAFHSYLIFLQNYSYSGFNNSPNAVCETARLIIEKQEEKELYDSFLTFGMYEDKNITNLINLTALTELMYFIKDDNDWTNNNIEYVHDRIKEFEPTILSEIKGLNINLEFCDSKESDFIQISDNIASITNHAFIKLKKHFIDKTEWDKDSEWDMKLAAKVFRRITPSNIKFTVPWPDWAASLCATEIFSAKDSLNLRNNIVFNQMYCEKLKQIGRTVETQKEKINKTMDVIMR